MLCCGAGGFYLAVLKFAMVILVASPLVASADFVEQRLILEWRRFLTRELLEGYYSNRAYFRLHQQVGLLDNPDQARTTAPLYTASWFSRLGCCLFSGHHGVIAALSLLHQVMRRFPAEDV